VHETRRKVLSVPARRRPLAIIGVIVLGTWLLGSPLAAQQDQPTNRPLVLVATLADDVINPITARFLIRTIEQAEQRRAACLIVQLDTPGGLVDSTRDITRRILDSAVPVVVYVAPSGGRAASAGLFITLAAHVAAMAPGTNIGAAHPVQLGGLPLPPPAPVTPADDSTGPREDDRTTGASAAEDKALRDTVAWARALAQLHGRNADWAERAVEESASATASEAAELGVVDFVATDIPHLLRLLDGREVDIAGTAVRLRVADAEVEMIQMWWRDRFLSAVANPNLAFLLLMFGFYGILLELYTPGWGVGGTVGVVCLILALFALSVLPVNYGGLALLAVGLALLVAEAFVTSYGFLSLGGVAAITMGGLMLIDSPVGFLRVSPRVVVPVAVATAVITVFLLSQVVRSHRRPPMTGSEGMLHERAVADEVFTLDDGSYVGVVRVHGELWRSMSAVPVVAGQAVTIESRDGMTLHVQPDIGERGDQGPA